MTESHAEPVEISVRMRPSEWTPESLVELTASYQRKLFEMGAPESEVLMVVDTPEDGSASVRVSWLHQGAHTFAALNQVESPEAEHTPAGTERTYRRGPSPLTRRDWAQCSVMPNVRQSMLRLRSGLSSPGFGGGFIRPVPSF